MNFNNNYCKVFEELNPGLQQICNECDQIVQAKLIQGSQRSGRVVKPLSPMSVVQQSAQAAPVTRAPVTQAPAAPASASVRSAPAAPISASASVRPPTPALVQAALVQAAPAQAASVTRAQAAAAPSTPVTGEQVLQYNYQSVPQTVPQIVLSQNQQQQQLALQQQQQLALQQQQLALQQQQQQSSSPPTSSYFLGVFIIMLLAIEVFFWFAAVKANNYNIENNEGGKMYPGIQNIGIYLYTLNAVFIPLFGILIYYYKLVYSNEEYKKEYLILLLFFIALIYGAKIAVLTLDSRIIKIFD